MTKTPSLGHCIKNTCFWNILKGEGSGLKVFVNVSKAVA